MGRRMWLPTNTSIIVMVQSLNVGMPDRTLLNLVPQCRAGNRWKDCASPLGTYLSDSYICTLVELVISFALNSPALFRLVSPLAWLFGGIYRVLIQSQGIHVAAKHRPR